MLKKLTLLFLNLVQSYLFVIVVALIFALAWPSMTVLLAPGATLFLQIIFFLTSLKLDPKSILKEIADVRMLALCTFFMLIALPAIVFLIAQAVVPSMAVALLLLATMPTGMTAPLLVEVVGGKTSMALIIALLTSLLAPFTVPFMIGLFASASVTVSALAMFTTLAKVILLPFVLAQLLRLMWPQKLQATFFTFKPISVILLGLLIAGVVAKQAHVILNGLGTTILFQLIVLSIFICALLAVGYFIAFWRSPQERMTITVCTTFMNFTLAIYLAGEFFPDPSVTLATVLVIFPWSLLLLPYRFVLSHVLPTV